MTFDNLPPLREVIATHKLQAQKRWGQNFLFDLNLTNKIARQAGDLANRPVLEIGPGPGGLTRALLAQGAYVWAIEYDERCLPALEQISAAYPGRLTVIAADARQQDYLSLAQSMPAKPKIISNLPYNISTQLLVHWLTQASFPPFYDSLTLMFQREVAERIVAQPNSSAYGRLSVLANWRLKSKIVLNITASAFTPMPKINSSVVHFQLREAYLPCNIKNLEKVTQLAFSQRRKMLRQSLKNIGGEKILRAAGVDPTKRAENLSIETFVALANKLEEFC